MIDIEAVVFTAIQEKLNSEYPGIYVTGENTPSPSECPAVSIVEMDSYEDLKTRDSSGTENSVLVMYEVNVYSNSGSGKKTQAGELMEIVSDEMKRLGFTRTFKRPIPNKENLSIYRIVARFSAGVDKNKNIYDM